MRNSATERGRSHRSSTVRVVGWEGQEKRWDGVSGAPLQEVQRLSGALPTMTLKVFKEEQNPERSWDSVVR